MDIKNNYQSPYFGLKIYDNTAFREVINIAIKQKKLLELDGVLNNLLHVEGQDIVIIHGTANNAMYSTFTAGKRSIQNLTTGCKSPAEASLKALFDLVDRDNPKLMRLLGSKVNRDLSEAKIIARYTTK